VNANFFSIGTSLFGFGNPGFSNVGCETATPFSFASVGNIPPTASPTTGVCRR